MMSGKYFVLLSILILASPVLAGELSPVSPPGPTMHTLQEIYDKVADVERKIVGNLYSGNYKNYVFMGETGSVQPDIFTTIARTIDYMNRGTNGWSLKPNDISITITSGNGATGSFHDNGSGALYGRFSQVPGGQNFPGEGSVNYVTGAWSLSLDKAFLGPADISYSYVVQESIAFANYDAPLQKTGQTTSYAGGDDGDLRIGMAWPNPRFSVDAETNTVTDRLVGLMWASAPHSLLSNSVFYSWSDALEFCNNLEFAGYSDWRLPNRRELFSLIDDGNHAYALPTDHPFVGLRYGHYWSSTTADHPEVGWSVGMEIGDMGYRPKNELLSVWPVRGPINLSQ